MVRYNIGHAEKKKKKQSLKNTVHVIKPTLEKERSEFWGHPKWASCVFLTHKDLMMPEGLHWARAQDFCDQVGHSC